MTADFQMAGIGMIPFPESGKGTIYYDIDEQAGRAILANASVDHTQVQQADTGYVYRDSTSGQSEGDCVVAHSQQVDAR